MGVLYAAQMPLSLAWDPASKELESHSSEIGAWGFRASASGGSQQGGATYSCLTPTVQHFPGGLEAMLLDVRASESCPMQGV